MTAHLTKFKRDLARRLRAGDPRRPGQPLRALEPQIKKWLAHKDRRRWHLPFIPTSSPCPDLI